MFAGRNRMLEMFKWAHVCEKHQHQYHERRQKKRFFFDDPTDDVDI